MDKIDKTNIVLKFKPDDYLKQKIFFNLKKRYPINICAIYDSSKKFIYIFAK